VTKEIRPTEEHRELARAALHRYENVERGMYWPPDRVGAAVAQAIADAEARGERKALVGKRYVAGYFVESDPALAQARREALEEAAKLVHGWKYPFEPRYAPGLERAERAIRALIENND
jgi:hypothetical protein